MAIFLWKPLPGVALGLTYCLFEGVLRFLHFEFHFYSGCQPKTRYSGHL